ncbi:MAG: endonuclease/exonuclease/phosphatase family protein [Promethearchaeota archaeon]
MIKDIFGSIVPSYFDVLASILLPQGSFILLNLVLISIGLGMFYISFILYAKTRKNRENLINYNFKLVGGFLFLVSLFVTFLLAIILVILMILSISNFVKVFKAKNLNYNQEREYKKNSQIITTLIFVFNFLLLVVILIGGTLLAFLLGWWVYGWTLQIGVIAGGIILILKKMFKIKFFENKGTLRYNSEKPIKILLVVFPILFGSIFITMLIPAVRLSVPDAPTSDEPTNLTIMTYNIRLGTGIEEDPENQWFNRKEKFVEYLDSFDLDVFGIQEAQYFQIQYIHENLKSRDYSWIGQGRDNGIHDGEACAIFYDSDKFEFIDGDTFWLSDFPDYPSNTWGGGHNRIVTWVRLEVTTGKSEGAQFVIFCTHYDFGDNWQVKASKLLMKRMTEYSGGLPTIIMGDFNLHNDSKAFPILENYEKPGDNKPMKDAYRVYMVDQLGYLPYATTSPQNWDVRDDPDDNSRIDFIFISKHIDVNKCRIPRDSYDGHRTYSDHYPVYMDCTF